MTQHMHMTSPEGLEAVRTARTCWNAREEFRNERERNKRYTFGDQWKDLIYVDGAYMTEEQYICREGNLPLANNLIRRLVRSVVGVFRARLEEEAADLDARATELYSRTMEEFLISGLAVHRKYPRRTPSGTVVETGIVSPDAFFFDPSARDPEGRDVNIVGQVHDLALPVFLAAFADTPARYARFSALYGGEPHVRVYEVWTRERLPRYLCHDVANARLLAVDAHVLELDAALRAMPSRWALHDVWRYRYVTAAGEVLCSGDSPWPHGGHPFVFKGYPFLDGEIHSFVHDVIDQQHYTNRLITLYDWTMRAAAKGVLLFPEETLPEGSEGVQGVMDQWSRFNGVIVYRPRPGIPEPRQVSNTSANSGIADLLGIQLKMMEDIAGVNGALQGRMENMTASGTLYERQTENALTSLRDILDSFGSFMNACRSLDGALSGAL